MPRKEAGREAPAAIAEELNLRDSDRASGAIESMARMDRWKARWEGKDEELSRNRSQKAWKQSKGLRLVVLSTFNKNDLINQYACCLSMHVRVTY